MLLSALVIDIYSFIMFFFFPLPDSCGKLFLSRKKIVKKWAK